MVDMQFSEEDMVPAEELKFGEGNMSEEELKKLNDVFNGTDTDTPKEEAEQAVTTEENTPVEEELKEAEVSGDLVEFEFEGEKVKLPKTVKEKLEKGVLRQADYTRKTQELAELKRQELAKMAMNNYNYQAEYVEPIIPPYPQVTRPDKPMNVEFASPVEEKLFSEVQTIKQSLTQLQKEKEASNQRMLMERVERECNTFRSKHPDMSDDQFLSVLDKANKIGARASVEALEIVYNGMLDYGSVKESAKRELLNELKKKNGAALVAPKTTVPKGQEQKIDVTKLDAEQRRLAMVHMLEHPEG